MESMLKATVPEWRYRAICRPAGAPGSPAAGGDPFEARAHATLAAEGLPWCFGEMDFPHWRRVPVSLSDSRAASYYAGDDPAARDAALCRLVLCARCPVFDRCHKITMAKKDPSPNISARKKQDMLAALARR